MIAGWFEDLERDVRACFGHGCLTPEQLAARLGVSPAAAVSFILLLAGEGRLRIEQVSLGPAERFAPGIPGDASAPLGGARAGALSRAA